MKPLYPQARRHLMARRAAMSLAPLGGAALTSASAEDNRPLQIIVGYTPGGGTDVLARVLGEPLAKALGRPVVVRNVPGAGGQIAATTLLREGGDGLSILAINHPDLYMAVARSTASFKASDFQVIMVDVQDPRVLLVRAGSEIGSFAGFVARAKAQPGKLAVSVTGTVPRSCSPNGCSTDSPWT